MPLLRNWLNFNIYYILKTTYVSKMSAFLLIFLWFYDKIFIELFLFFQTLYTFLNIKITMGGDNMSYAFIRKRSKNYIVYLEYTDETTGKKKQKNMGSYPLPQ